MARGSSTSGLVRPPKLHTVSEYDIDPNTISRYFPDAITGASTHEDLNKFRYKSVTGVKGKPILRTRVERR